MRSLILFCAAVLAASATPLTAEESAFAQAREASRNGDWPAAAEAYERHLAERPGDAWSWYALGSIRHGLGDFAGAIQAFEQSLEKQVSVPAVAHYNLACSRARAGESEAALAALAEAAPGGLVSRASIEADPDLESLRDHPRFETIVGEADLAYRPCQLKKEHRQFDFWVGDWEVRIAQGFLAARDRVEKSEDGCVVRQDWQGSFGFTGRSWSFYDAAREAWVQTWVGRAGGVTTLEGGWVDGAMVLEGPGTTGPDSRVRSSWRPNPDGSITFSTATSADAGQTWTDAPAGPFTYAEADG